MKDIGGYGSWEGSCEIHAELNHAKIADAKGRILPRITRTLRRYLCTGEISEPLRVWEGGDLIPIGEARKSGHR